MTPQDLGAEADREHLDQLPHIDSLMLLNSLDNHSVEEMLTLASHCMLQATQSHIVAVGLVSEDERTVALRICSDQIESPPSSSISLPLTETSPWAEIFRERRSLILNSISQPLCHGFLCQNLPVTTFLGVPCFEKQRLVAVAGLANRQNGYQDIDLMYVEVFLSQLWRMIRNKVYQDMTRLQLDASRALSSCTDFESVCTTCLNVSVKSSGMDCGGIYLKDPESGDLILKCHIGLSEAFISQVSRVQSNAQTASLVLQGTPIYTHYGKLISSDDILRLAEGLKAFAMVPIRHAGEVIGCMNVASHHVEEISPLVRDTLELIVADMGQAIVRSMTDETLRLSEKRCRSLFEGAKIVLKGEEYATTARRLFDIARDLTGAPSGYVALLREEGDENEVLFLESGGLPCSVDHSLPMPVRGLREVTYRTGEVRLENHFDQSPWMSLMPPGHVRLRNVLFAPLTIDKRMVGLMGLANKPTDFTEEDKHVSLAIGQLLAIALRNARNLEALKESEFRYRTIVENISDAIYICDLSGRILDANERACLLSGFAREEMINAHISMLHSQVNPPLMQKRMEELRRNSKLTFEGMIMRQGKSVPVEVNARIIHHEGSDMIHTFVRDISERQEIQEQRIRNQRLEAVGILAGGIAHDFNNLLAGILGNIEMARVSSPAGGKISDYLGKALGVTERARALTDQLLTFAKGGNPLRKPGDLGKLARNTVPFALSGSSITPVFTIGPDLWACEFDEGQIGQALDNLVINAQQAMPMGGHIEIEIRNVSLDDPAAQRSGRFVMISIQDHGIGIPENLLSRIFDPFFTTKQKGQGLGLATTHSIVEKHAGFMKVESRPGEGSTFRLYLPATDEDPTSADASKPTCHRGSGRILIMDDEEFIRDLVSDMLASMGYSVVTVKDGMAVLAEYARCLESEAPFKAILLDLTVPGGQGGREIIRDLRKLDPQAIVIAASGYSADPVMSAPSEHGFSGSIQKPFSLADLGRLLTDLLRAN